MRYCHKKSKQRYLDYAYKIALKRAFEWLIDEKYISGEEVENIYIFVDEHTTATNGKYELEEGLERELKIGTFNFNYVHYFPPLFSQLKSLQVYFCDSKSKTLVRAADIVANRIYWDTIRYQNTGELKDSPNLKHIFLPHQPKTF